RLKLATSWPRATRPRQSACPRNPPPPVTSTRTPFLAASVRRRRWFEHPAGAQFARGPRGQLLAADLGIVADVDRERRRMEGEAVDVRRVHMALADMAELVG